MIGISGTGAHRGLIRVALMAAALAPIALLAACSPPPPQPQPVMYQPAPPPPAPAPYVPAARG